MVPGWPIWKETGTCGALVYDSGPHVLHSLSSSLFHSSFKGKSSLVALWVFWGLRQDLTWRRRARSPTAALGRCLCAACWETLSCGKRWEQWDLLDVLYSQHLGLKQDLRGPVRPGSGPASQSVYTEEGKKVLCSPSHLSLWAQLAV